MDSLLRGHTWSSLSYLLSFYTTTGRCEERPPKSNLTTSISLEVIRTVLIVSFSPVYISHLRKPRISRSSPMCQNIPFSVPVSHPFPAPKTFTWCPLELTVISEFLVLCLFLEYSHHLAGLILFQKPALPTIFQVEATVAPISLVPKS